MKTQVVNGIEVHRGSDNAFADLGLPDAEKLKIKAGLVIEIRKAMRKHGLTQQEAARRMGITQPKVSDMMRGDFANLSERKLMDCLTRLGYDIEIKVREAKADVGHLMLTPVRATAADKVRMSLAERALDDRDIADAVAWARSR